MALVVLYTWEVFAVVSVTAGPSAFRAHQDCGTLSIQEHSPPGAVGNRA